MQIENVKLNDDVNARKANYSSITTTIKIVPNGFFVSTCDGKVVTFVRNKKIASFDNHTFHFGTGEALAVNDVHGKALVNIDKSGFKNFDNTVFKDLVKNWTNFWSAQ